MDIRTKVATVLAKQDDKAAPTLGHYLDADALIAVFDIKPKPDTEDHVRCCGTPEPQYNCPETV